MYYELEAEVNGKTVKYHRVESDNNGNPRYVIHFLEIDDDYETACNIAKEEIGGRKYRAKWFDGGIVFTSYNIYRDFARVIRLESQ